MMPAVYFLGNTKDSYGMSQRWESCFKSVSMDNCDAQETMLLTYAAFLRQMGPEGRNVFVFAADVMFIE